MAVQGAAPRSTAPARYRVASSGEMKGLNITVRNSQARPYMVKGLISQFAIQVTNSPFGFFPTSRMLWKSTLIIIG